MPTCRGCNGEGTVWQSGRLVRCSMCGGSGSAPHPIPPPKKKKKS